MLPVSGSIPPPPHNPFLRPEVLGSSTPAVEMCGGPAWGQKAESAQPYAEC